MLSQVTVLISNIYFVVEVFGIMATYGAITPKTSLKTYIIEINTVTLAKRGLKASW